MSNTSPNNAIANSLGINPIAAVDYSKTVTAIIEQALSDTARDDFTFARSNIRDAVVVATEAINNLSQIASSRQDARSFEVLAKLIDTVVTANRELLSLQQQIREINNVDDPINNHQPTSVTNHNLFIGSTAELQLVLEDLKKKDKDNIIDV